jgi:hypothetical protein
MSTGTDIAPAPQAPAPAVPQSAPAPAVPQSAPAPAQAPAPGGAVVPATNRLPVPARGVPTNLAAESWLDMIMSEMRLLNADLDRIREGLDILGQVSESLDATITNVDELGKFYEAPAATRAALDADGMVTSMIDDLVVVAYQHCYSAQSYNATAFTGLRGMADVQDRQRGRGAGPRLMATAGRH